MWLNELHWLKESADAIRCTALCCAAIRSTEIIPFDTSTLEILYLRVCHMSVSVSFGAYSSVC